MASRGMGAIMPSKIPKAKRKARRDDTDFDQYADGGEVEIKSNPAKTDYSVRAMGGTGEFGVGAGGRFTMQKNLGKDLDLEAYLEGQAMKPKSGSTRGSITGGGVKLTKRFKEGGEVWDKERPKDLGKPQKLSAAKKASAKARAKRAGRPYPNLIDNMRAAK